MSDYRDMNEQDTIQVNDEWFTKNFGAEGGEWKVVNPGNALIGVAYKASIMKPMRRIIEG